MIKTIIVKGSLAILLAVNGIGQLSYAHPGGTASDGCHYCWTDCRKWEERYGVRHCHGRPNSNINTLTIEKINEDDYEVAFCNSMGGRMKIRDYDDISVSSIDDKNTLNSARVCKLPPPFL